MNINQKKLKDRILLYQYAYYVKALKLVTDFEYDLLEKGYIKKYGDDLDVGSDSENDYPKYIVAKFKNKEFRGA